jgi:hypothetical protein
MPARHRRICGGYCDLLTEEPYADPGWEAAGNPCEERSVADLADMTIDEEC